MRILLVEDDSIIIEGLSYSLEKEGFDVTAAGSVRAAKAYIESEHFDLCLLDITLPDGDGHELCRLIKERGNTPVIFLTALDDEGHAVMALDQGADDYVTKPFRLRELTARINAVLRRASGHSDAGAELTITKGISVNPYAARVLRDGQELSLTSAEYKLLMLFVNNRGRTMTRSFILDGMWDCAGDFVNDNTLTVYIKRLREKLGDDDGSVIKTIRGTGYRMEKL